MPKRAVALERCIGAFPRGPRRCSRFTDDPSRRCPAHRNPSAEDLAREQLVHEREEAERKAARRNARPRTAPAHFAFQHAYAARQVYLPSKSPHQFDDSWVCVRDLEQSISGWFRHVADLLKYLEKHPQENGIELQVYIHTAGQRGGNFGQSGSLMVDWEPTAPPRENYGTPRHEQRNEYGDRINRLVEIKAFDRAIDFATQNPDGEDWDPHRQRAAAHLVAGVAKHLEDITSVLKRFVRFSVRQNFDIEIVQELDAEAPFNEQLLDFRITAVNWFDPKEREKTKKEERVVRREEEYLERVAKTLPCSPEILVSTYVAQDRDHTRTTEALKALNLKIPPSTVRDIIARLEKHCPKLWATHTGEAPAQSTAESQEE
jgi:hypothetical protein